MIFIFPRRYRGSKFTSNRRLIQHAYKSVSALYVIIYFASHNGCIENAYNYVSSVLHFIIIIIIIIIKKVWQCKAGRGRLTPYWSEDPSPALPTYRGKEEKGKIVEHKKGESN